ncbi:hypothetical protein AB1N83_008242 [Pleurotus pulmonarius]
MIGIGICHESSAVAMTVDDDVGQSPDTTCWWQESKIDNGHFLSTTREEAMQSLLQAGVGSRSTLVRIPLFRLFLVVSTQGLHSPLLCVAFLLRNGCHLLLCYPHSRPLPSPPFVDSVVEAED